MQSDLKFFGTAAVIVLVVFGTLIGVAVNVAWIEAGKKAEVLRELTGQEITQYQIFWAGDSIRYDLGEEE